MEKINSQTGLTPQQEQAIILLVSGKNYSEIAKELKIDRSTLYIWSEKIPFQSYFNKLCKEVQDEVKNSLAAMYNDAVIAIQDSLKHDNPTVRFKSASWLIEKLETQKIGATNPRETFIKMATQSVWSELTEETVNRNLYEQLCREHGIEP